MRERERERREKSGQEARERVNEGGGNCCNLCFVWVRGRAGGGGFLSRVGACVCVVGRESSGI